MASLCWNGQSDKVQHMREKKIRKSYVRYILGGFALTRTAVEVIELNNYFYYVKSIEEFKSL